MTDKSPEIRKLAREKKIIFTKHALERIHQYDLTTMQVREMLKQGSVNKAKGDEKGYRVEGKAPASDNTGYIHLSAHVAIIDKLLVITVIKPN
ncbi:MAG: DUF4258 domain-containing protein [Chlamydiia bacterium]|nr:DUF4258 domain-containing protein [Chlamydiia bacterium]